MCLDRVRGTGNDSMEDMRKGPGQEGVSKSKTVWLDLQGQGEKSYQVRLGTQGRVRPSQIS